MSEEQVLAANARFYDAFVRRDTAAMEALWARELPVACVHPGWSALRGRARVLASFRGILENPEAPKLRCVGPSVHLLGEVAFVVCYEEVDGGRLLATNIFAKEENEWRMVHHQAGPTSRGGKSEPPDLESMN